MMVRMLLVLCVMYLLEDLVFLFGIQSRKILVNNVTSFGLLLL